jgi:predicted dehydrogenase/aryl-alcohol dehydrogenase-like predicted oxidoreductase
MQPFVPLQSDAAAVVCPTSSELNPLEPTTVTAKLNWGILSTGAIAKAFALGVQTSKHGKLVAVGSRSQASADKFAEQFAIPAAGRHASYEALLADKNVQAVYIATPHPLHAEWAIKAAQAGKHVLCEKPLALNAHQVGAMQAAAAENGTFLMEAFMYRCHPQTARLVEIISSGAIGQVRMIQATFSFHAGFNPEGRLYNNAMGGGGILDVGCYAASFARLIAGAADGKPYLDPVQVVAAGHVGQSNVDEYAAAVLKFPNNIVAQIATGVAVNQDNSARIYGSEGWIHVPNPWTADRQKGNKISFTVHAKGKPAEEITTETDRTAFSLEADVVAQAVAEGKHEPQAPAMTWGDTLGNLRTLDQWRAAIGLTYEAETPEKNQPVYGRPIARRAKVNMPYGRIPGLDKDVSRLILGCDNQQNFAHASIMFDEWIERGGNAFDTSWVYGGGRQEVLLGQWIKSRGIRKDVVIATKGAHTPRCTPELMIEDFKTSLERIQLDETDIYIMHRDNLDVPVGEFVEVLNQWRDQGRVKVFGGSNWSIERFEAFNEYAAKHGKEPMRILNNNLSLAHMVKEVWKGCLHVSDKASRDWLEKNQVTEFSWSSQARGYFLGDDEWKKLGEGNFECWDSPDNRRRRERAQELAKKKNCLPINIALAYLMHQPFPVYALVGPRTPMELFTTLPGLDVTLTPEEVSYLALDA